MRIHCLPLFALLFCVSGVVPALAERPAVAPQPQAPEAPPAMTVIQERDNRLIVSLPNRLIIAVQRVPAAPVVSAQVWVKTGSIYEQEHVGAGLSHFLEHLVSGGTTSNRTEAESNAILGSIGGQTNAATSLDNVYYYINTTADHAPVAIDLLSDWLQHNVVKPSEFDREREVIQSEFKMGMADPNRIFWKLTQRARYSTHPARHPTIGYLDEFMTITRDGIYDFYKRMYVPNNMVFVVAGDVDPAATVAQIAGLWKDAQPRELPALRFPLETGRGEPFTIKGQADIRQPRLRLAFPNVKLGEPGDYELDMLAMILGDGESSRLITDLRDKQRLVTSINAFNWSTTWGEAMFGIDAELAAGVEIEAVKAAILEHVARLREEPVTDQELARAKRKTLASIAKSGQTAGEVASTLARDILGPGDPDYRDKYIQHISALQADQLRAVAARMLGVEQLTTVILEPKPEGEALADEVRDADVVLPDDQYAPFELDNTRVIASLESNIADAAVMPAVEVGPVTTHTLDNGLRVVLQRSTVVPAVSIQLFSLGGLLADEPGREGIANAVSVMQRRGTTTRSAQDIAIALEDLGATLATGAGSNSAYVQASALRDDLPAVFDLFADVALRPSFPEEEWQSMKPRLLAAIDRERESIWGEIRVAFREKFYGEHPWSQPTNGRRDVVESLAADHLRSAFAQRLSAKETVIAVVGDIDPDQALALIKQHFGAMPAAGEAAFEAKLPAAHEPGVWQEAIEKPGSAVQIGFAGIARDHPDFAAMEVMSRVMSDFPAGYLEQELRGRGPGIAYGVHAGMQTGLVPGYFAIIFNTRDPELTIEGIRRSLQVVSLMREAGFTDADLARAKAKVRTGEAMSRQSNSGRAMGMALDILYGVDDLSGEAFLREVAGMDAKRVQAVARKYLTDPLTVVVTSAAIDEAELKAAVLSEPVPAVE